MILHELGSPRLSGVSGTRCVCGEALSPLRLSQHPLSRSLKVRLFDKYAVDHFAFAVLDLVVCHLNAALNLDAILLGQNGQDHHNIADPKKGGFVMVRITGENDAEENQRPDGQGR